MKYEKLDMKYGKWFCVFMPLVSSQLPRQVAEPYALLYNPPFAGKVNI
jgi:hypothetical protein